MIPSVSHLEYFLHATGLAVGLQRAGVWSTGRGVEAVAHLSGCRLGGKKNTDRTDHSKMGESFSLQKKDGFPCGLFFLRKLPQMQRNRVIIKFYTRL